MRAPGATRRRGALMLIGLALAAAACASPEATRMRAGGPGGDVGNQSAEVRTHEGSAPYYRTPHLDGITGPSIEPANQARRLSRR